MTVSEILMNAFPWYAAELFLRVCESGGLSAASRFGKIGISQPALSAQMNTLEQHLGVKLFRRKPFELTAEGRIFQDEALRLRSSMMRLRDSLAQDSAKPLRIAASDVIIRDYLPDLLKKIDVPSRTRLVLREAPSQDLAGLVRDGDADLAIGMLSRHVQAGSSPLVEIIARLPIVLYIPPSHAETVKNWSDLAHLLRQPAKPGLIALPHHNLFTQHINATLRKSGLEWHPTLEVSSLSQIVSYVDLDFGFGFGISVPETKNQRNGGHHIALSSEQMPPLSLGVWHGETLDPLAVRLLSHIRSYANEHLEK